VKTIWLGIQLILTLPLVKFSRELQAVGSHNEMGLTVNTTKPTYATYAAR
jgi:hypothetical protein